MVADIFDPDAGFLHHFPSYGFLDGFPLIHKAGQRRIAVHRRQAAPGLSQQAAVAIGYYHNYHRVDPGEMLGLADGTFPFLPAALDHRGLAADGAVAVPVMPVDLRPALRQDAGFRPAEQVFGGGTGFLKAATGPGFGGRRGRILLGQVKGKIGNAIEQAQKQGDGGGQVGRQIGPRQPAQAGAAGVVGSIGNQSCRPPQRQKAAGGFPNLGLNPILIPPFHLAPVQWIGGENMRLLAVPQRRRLLSRWGRRRQKGAARQCSAPY